MVSQSTNNPNEPTDNPVEQVMRQASFFFHLNFH